MHRRPRIGERREDDEGPPLPPMATGIVLGVWISIMLILALVVVPILFDSCFPAPPGT